MVGYLLKQIIADCCIRRVECTIRVFHSFSAEENIHVAANHFQINYINSNTTFQWSLIGVALIQEKCYTSSPVGATLIIRTPIQIELAGVSYIANL